MFYFFTRRKQIVLDCFVESLRIAETYPIRRAFHHIPEWWRGLQPSIYEIEQNTGKPYERPTMKTCRGMTSLYKTGFIMPLWTDLDFFTSYEGFAYHSADSAFLLDRHSPVQHNHAFSKYHHVKLRSPWLFKEKTGVNFLLTSCPWTHLIDAPRLRVLHGVVDYRSQYTTHINCFIPREDATIRLQSDMPLAHFIPLTDKRVKTKIHVIDAAEYAKMFTYMHMHKFKGGHMKVVKEIKQCPMEKD